MAADIDVRTIATFASLSESAITSLLDSPTADLVKGLLHSIEKKAKEYDQSKSQKVKLEVELETVVRTNESKVKVLQNSRDRALNDVSKLREDIQTAEGTRAKAQADLDRLQQSVQSEASESVSLRSKITSLETSHRDTLSLLDSKSKEIDRLAQDSITEHQKLVDLRKTVSALERAKQEASSAATSAKFRQASLEQELELQKKNIDWYEDERKQKAEDHQKFRKDKNAKVSELQRDLEHQIEQVDALRRSENNLRSQLEDQAARLETLLDQKQKLEEKEITDAEHRRIEVDGLSRLVELQKAAADTAKARVDELSFSLDETKDAAAEEIGKIRAEVQEEHNDRQAAEQRVAELEAQLRELQAEIHQSQTQPATPRNDANGQMPATPARPGTPLGSQTPRSTIKLRNGMTTSQMYSQIVKMEKELAHANRANEQLQAYIDEMLADLEAKKPEIEELQADRARLHDDLVDASQLAEQAMQERNAEKKHARILQSRLDQNTSELEEARQACRDLGSQLRRLLLEQEAGQLSESEWERLLAEADQRDQREMEHLSNNQQVVNRYLLGFRNIAELQALNEKQATEIRNLVAQVESEAAQETKQRCEQLEKAMESADAQISAYQTEIKRMVAESQSFIKERDMFRNMLTRRGHAEPTNFGASLPNLGDRGSPAADGDVARALNELQSRFDDYRRETGTDHTSLKSQNSDLSQRNSQLQAEASRSLGQFTAAQQRYDMLQANYSTLKSDHAELQKRSNNVLESATKLELKSQQAAEELVEAKGLADGLRREAANLKAEKDLWKSIEKRLVDDNEALRNERSRLDQLNASLQNLLNEKEHSDVESRRRLQSQIDALETELQSARRKLEDEMEDQKQTSLRRNYEQDHNQKRVDDLIASLGATREELASAKTARDHLQARVDEMTVELRSAEERLEVMARPSATPALHTNGVEEGSLSQEQELAVEVSELKRDLDLRSAELAKAEEHLEEYKGIAQSAEERLEQFMETNEEDKADLHASINEKEQKIKDVEQRVEDISTELSNTNSELSKLRDEQAEAGRNLEEQKVDLQAEIERLKASEEKAVEQATLYLEASKEQQKIAEQRQQNYETELLKHTEAVKTLQTVRAAANQVRLDLAEAKTQADNAKADLQQKEASWQEAEARYKQETLDIKNRRAEIEQQNEALHVSLATYNTQLASLRRDRGLVQDVATTEHSQGEPQDLASFHETIEYLRQENTIVELRYRMAGLELTRLKGQLESTQTHLDEARLRLDQQQRATIDVEKNAMSHNKLMETLNDLNLHRESVVTLRAEKKQAEQSLNEKTQRLEQLEQELIPLKSRVTELEHLLELKQGEMELLQKDRDGWQQRTQNILSKYDRVDPAELEELKNRISELEVERDQAIEAQTPLQVQIDALPETLEAARSELRQRLTDQFKNRDRDMKEKRNQLQTELSSVKAELEAAKATIDEQAANISESQNREEGENVEQSQHQADEHVRELEAKMQELEASVADKDAQIASLTTDVEEGKHRIEAMKEKLNKRLAEVKKEIEATKQTALDELSAKLTAQHQEELELLRASLSTQRQEELEALKPPPNPASEEVQKPIESTIVPGPGHNVANTIESIEQVLTSMNAEQARELLHKNPTIHGIFRKNLSTHVEKRIAALQEAQAQAQPSVTNADVEQKAREAEEKFEAEKQDLIRQKDEEFQIEREAIIKEQQAAFEAEKQALINEQQRMNNDEVAKAKASTEKMLSGKLTLVQKQSAGHLAKINVVKKAVEETPEKPVKEVWEVAKTAKPDTPKPAIVPAPAAPSVTASAPEPAASTAVEPASSEIKTDIGPETDSAPSSAPITAADAQGTEQATEQAQPSQPAAATTPSAQSQPARSSALPQPMRGNFANRGQRGSTQGGRGSGIPRGGGFGNPSVSTNSRGRGASRGVHNPGSPSRGGGASMNPNAQQFTPQAKRPREEGEDAGNQGKRIRGGGASS